MTDCAVDGSKCVDNEFDAVASIAPDFMELALQLRRAAPDSLYRKSVTWTTKNDIRSYRLSNLFRFATRSLVTLKACISGSSLSSAVS